MAFRTPAAPGRAAICAAVALLLVAVCGAAQGGAVLQGATSAQGTGAAVPEPLGPQGRRLAQTDIASASDCDDCACVKVRCATYCGSGNNIESFTCDEAGWFSDGSFYCTCYATSTPSGNTGVSSSAASTGALARLALVATAVVCALSFWAL